MSTAPVAPAGPSSCDSIGLGKRKANMISDQADAWAPGAGVPCYPFGSKGEVQKRTKQFKTTMLFLELQAQVKQAIQNKHKADQAERELSFSVAQRNPINETPVVLQAAPATRKPESIDMEYISAKKKSALMEVDMPAPLSPKILEAARKELPAGAVFSIETCLKCWRENKMAKDEVLFTIKTFASASPSLVKALESKEQQHRGEAATQAQMRELAMLACA